uniref:Uncharacterized LOC100177318 n=1 Tax=Ciona intestinalis TaxID=7719 RepID=H2XM11_CIOIN|nr:uncharacterized protein LOC100177318 [Ciona intestinalis]|eukprot:XP_002122459.1 uncharacterized protein LOC100177318 [Ciona intestinalis]
MPKRRGISKPRAILLAGDEERDELVHALLRGLVSAKIKQIKFSLFSNLLQHHMKQGTIPPILKLDAKPPGFETPEYDRILSQWKNMLNGSSKRLLVALKCLYDDEVAFNGWLSSSLKLQCVYAITNLLDCDRATANSKVQECVRQALTTSLDELTQVFYDQTNRTHRDKTERFENNIDCECEETKYLKFANEVADDIRLTKTSSTTIMEKVMEHYEANQTNDLDLRSMRQSLENLKADLGFAFEPSTSNQDS